MKLISLLKKESVNEGKYDADLDKIEAAVMHASSFMNVGSELKKMGIKYDFSTSMIPMYRIKVSGNTIAIVNKKYAAGSEREVKDMAIGLMENIIKESVNEENKPTNPALWSRAKAAAKAKYDVYPSAYANGYASKWYKEKGGSWKTENTSPTDMEEGNEFGAERAKAIAANKDSFEVDGKTYKVTGVDVQDKENAKDFANESMKLTSMLKKSKSKK